MGHCWDLGAKRAYISQNGPFCKFLEVTVATFLSSPDKLETLSPELEVLIEEFRDEALRLLDMLDQSPPVVQRIKVWFIINEPIPIEKLK